MVEVNFDGLIGPTYNDGLNAGIVPSQRAGSVTNPRAAALAGLAKIRLLRSLGLRQAVLPPHPRPNLDWLRRLGFCGDDAEVLRRAAVDNDGMWLRLCSNPSSMWAANAATVAPSSDTRDGRVHLLVANLQHMFHRAQEPEVTEAVLRAIFRDEARFAVHPPLPAAPQLGDEGAANVLRLAVANRPAVHVFAWGRGAYTRHAAARFPARQTLEASQAQARVLDLNPAHVVFAQQHPDGLDGGASHTDVLAVAHGSLLLIHELALRDVGAFLGDLRRRLGSAFQVALARSAELPLQDAVATGVFSSQFFTLPNGQVGLVVAAECRENPTARDYLDRLVADGHLAELREVDMRPALRHGGGPASLRLRVPLTDAELAALGGRVLVDDALDAELVAWVETYYRDRLAPEDLADPQLLREMMTALDALTQILQLGSVYPFQRT